MPCFTVLTQPRAVCILLLLPVQFVPQSPRFLILHGQADKALSVLNLVARINCKPRLHGRLVTVEEKERMQRDGELPDSNSNRQTDEEEDRREVQSIPPSSTLLPSNGKSKVGITASIQSTRVYMIQDAASSMQCIDVETACMHPSTHTCMHASTLVAVK